MKVRPLSLCCCCAAMLALLTACSSAPDEEVTAVSTGGPAGGAGGGPTGLGPAGSVSASGLPAGIVPGSQEDLEYSVGDTVLFGFDSTVINSAGEVTLQGQSRWLDQYPQQMVTIEGHADERGTREYNLALGERRATAVKNYLTALGVDSNRMLTLSYGEERPVDPGKTEEAYARNRRAVTVVNRTN